MVKNNDHSGYRILIAAISISFAWHILCLSAVNIVSSPMRKREVKFSKVSFLGPILARVNMDVRAAPAVRSLLERRYLKIAENTLLYKGDGSIKAPDSKYSSHRSSVRTDGKLLSAIDDAVAGEKLEPDYLSE